MRALSGILVVGVLAALAGCGEKPATKTEAGGAAKPAASAPSPLTAAGWPKRKPGLWTQTVKIKDRDFSPSFRFCIDAATDAKLGLDSQGMDTRCTKGQMTRTADGGWTVTSACDMGPAGKAQSTVRVSGDFNSRYLMEIDSVTTGATQAAMNGQHKMTITAEWSGACPADWAAGDVEMPGGRRMNLLTKAVSGGG
jgi:hypothetical protein